MAFTTAQTLQGSNYTISTIQTCTNQRLPSATKAHITPRDATIPAIPRDSFDVNSTADPTKSAADNILPGKSVFGFEAAFI